MADGARRDDWSHTSNILAMLVNVNRGPGAPVARASQFSPYGDGDKQKSSGDGRVVLDKDNMKSYLDRTFGKR